MNVEIGTEAVQFPEKIYKNGIAFAVYDSPFTPYRPHMTICTCTVRYVYQEFVNYSICSL
jgi:hypothetical protein